MAVAFSLMPCEHHQMFVQALESIHLMKMHRPRSRCARPGDKRNKSDRKHFAKQTHGEMVLHWALPVYEEPH